MSGLTKKGKAAGLAALVSGAAIAGEIVAKKYFGVDISPLQFTVPIVTGTIAAGATAIDYLRDFKRVLGPAEACYAAGTWLKKRGLRFTTLAGILAAGALVTDVIGKQYFGFDLPVSTLNAAMIPAGAAFATFVPGQALTAASNVFSSRKILTAEANSLNLLEDRKKQNRDDHLGKLWDRVFKEESRLHYGDSWNEKRREELTRLRKTRKNLLDYLATAPDELKEVLELYNGNRVKAAKHIETFAPLSNQMETTKRGFRTSTKYALMNALPQSVEQSQIGFDLSLIEDWYDGAPFSNDTKLSEQYSANNAIRNIRKKVGIPVLTKLKESFAKNPTPIWHVLTTRKVGKKVGGLIDRLNKRHTERTAPDYFNAQHLLWDSPEIRADVVENLGEEAYEDLRKERKEMIREIFSDDRETAHTQIYNMAGKDYSNALELRLDYDVEFAAGQLPHTPLGDLEELKGQMMNPTCSNGKAEKRIRKKIEKAKGNMARIDDFLQDNLEDIYQDPLKRRAARIGYHINRFKLHKLIEKDPEKTKQIIRDWVSRADGRYTDRISKLRQHYELAKIQLADYVEMIDELGEYEPQTLTEKSRSYDLDAERQFLTDNPQMQGSEVIMQNSAGERAKMTFGTSENPSREVTEL